MQFDELNLRALKAALLVLLAAGLTTGCATQTKPYDYTAFKESRPASILVLPPINNSPDVAATYSMYSQVTYPLAESGYYVYPVTLVDETFRQNGLNNPPEMHEVTLKKLREIFGADCRAVHQCQTVRHQLRGGGERKPGDRRSAPDRFAVGTGSVDRFRFSFQR
jgi:hypothetical protein